MGTVTGYTAERMQEIEDSAIIDGDVVGNNLILTRYGGSTINAGNVRGPQGEVGPIEVPGRMLVPCSANGSDQINVIRSFEEEVDPGTILMFPIGPIGLSEPWVPAKALGIKGAGGRFGTRFIDLTDGDPDPLINFDTTIDSGDGIWGNYGSWMKDIAIDRPEGTGPCLRISTSVAHFQGESLFCQGGTIPLDIHGANAHFDKCLLWGATDCFINVKQSGLELDLTNIRMARNTPGITEAYFKVEIETGGSYGALYMDNVWGNCALGVGGEIIRPFIIESPTLSTFYSFLRQIILDNCKEAARLTRIRGFRYFDGYINCAAGTNNAVVELDGCVEPHFRANKLYGGSLDGSTFEFVGEATVSPILEKNLCPTGPVYKISTENEPITPILEDSISHYASASQITNNVEWLNLASTHQWGSRDFQSVLKLTESPILRSPMVGIAASPMVGGVVTIDAPGVNAATTQFLLFVYARGGVTGSLSVSTRDPVGGTGGLGSVTIISSSSDDTSFIGYVRFDII